MSTADRRQVQEQHLSRRLLGGERARQRSGLALYDELYDETSHSATQTAKVIAYLPTWRKDLDYSNAVMYQNITHGIIAFLQFDEKNLGELDDKSAIAVSRSSRDGSTQADLESLGARHGYWSERLKLSSMPECHALRGHTAFDSSRDVDARTRSVDLHRKGRPRVLLLPGTELLS
jgi:hypothetical protein